MLIKNTILEENFEIRFELYILQSPGNIATGNTHRLHVMICRPRNELPLSFFLCVVVCVDGLNCITESQLIRYKVVYNFISS